MSAHPSTAINISNLNGIEIIVGDNMNIPNASNIFATTRCKIINGTNMRKLISNDVG